MLLGVEYFAIPQVLQGTKEGIPATYVLSAPIPVLLSVFICLVKNVLVAINMARPRSQNGIHLSIQTRICANYDTQVLVRSDLLVLTDGLTKLLILGLN